MDNKINAENENAASAVRTGFVLLCLFVLTLTLSACASSGGTGPGQLARDWSCKIREMQIHPIFPLREDVNVGDVYWLATVAGTEAAGYCRPGSEYLPIPVKVSYSHESKKAADHHYNNRPDFPSTPKTTSTIAVTTTGVVITQGTASTSIPVSSSSLFASESGNANRLRLVAFPDYLTVKVDRASLGAIIPILGSLTPLGLSTETIESASISVPVAESYGVPVEQAVTNIPDATRSFLCRWGKNNSASGGQLHLVHEVFYARAIDINIQQRSATALGLSRDREDATTTTVAPITFTQSVTPGGTATVTVIHATTQQLGSVASNAIGILLSRNTVPGVSFSLERGRGSTITMRGLFEKPVAIGMRSSVISYNSTNGDCTKTTSEDAMVVSPGIGGTTPATAGKQ